MFELKVAFATDDGETLMDRHFGDAKFYDIYKITPEQAHYLKRIENSSPDEKEHAHGDPVKARGVTQLLAHEETHVVVSKVFGPNIKRIRKKFVCVMANNNSISQINKLLQSNLEVLQREWHRDGDRQIFNFKQ
ncbi:MAG: hypothetical protein J7L89_05985 [Bacteroidales bacterium]|nr:hypothetical protein [Bacteroidales bacterium]